MRTKFTSTRKYRRAVLEFSTACFDGDSNFSRSYYTGCTKSLYLRIRLRTSNSLCTIIIPGFSLRYCRYSRYLQVKVPKYSRTVLKFSTAFFGGNSIFTCTKPAVLQAVLVNTAIFNFLLSVGQNSRSKSTLST